MTLRSRTIDRTILAGWIVLAVIGQCILNKQVTALEIVATLWLFAGLLLVRRTACLPLLLLTCPVFMCEIQRTLAWVQWVAVIILLARVVIESRFTFLQWLVTMLIGTVVFAFSWPVNAGDLLSDLMRTTQLELFQQWFHAEAVWAIFPFREAFDRALVAMLCGALLMSGRYFSSRRIWNALALCGVLVIATALSASELSWQTPHRFLGTTNHARYAQYLLHGAGTNLSFFAILFAVGLPWWFSPLRTRWRAVLLGLTGFLFPLLLVPERVLLLVLTVLIPSCAAWLIYSLACPNRRAKVLKRWRMPVTAWVLMAALFVAGCIVSCHWYVKTGILDGTSSNRSQLGLGAPVPVKPTPSKASPVAVARPALAGISNKAASVARPPAASSVVAVSPAAGQQQVVPVSGLKRIEQWLIRHDAIRGPAWTLGFRHAIKHSLVRGSGAGTWARFHRSQPRPYRAYLAHMHNTYLDLLFEYGMIPMLIIFGLCAIAFLRIAFGYCQLSRLWLLYLIPISIMALGQHFFYAFTHLCLLIPAVMISVMAFRPGRRAARRSL